MVEIIQSSSNCCNSIISVPINTNTDWSHEQFCRCVCVCMYVCVCVYRCGCVHVCMYVCMYVGMCLCMYA